MLVTHTGTVSVPDDKQWKTLTKPKKILANCAMHFAWVPCLTPCGVAYKQQTKPKNRVIQPPGLDAKDVVDAD